MDPTGSAASSKPYKLPECAFKMLFDHHFEGLRQYLDGLQWLWALHCRGTGGILGNVNHVDTTVQVSHFLPHIRTNKLCSCPKF
jgi:DNA excision repair protein ERCC-6-like